MASLQVSPSSFPADTPADLTFAGTGFEPGAELILGLKGQNSEVVGNVPTDGSFSIVVSFTEPAGLYHPFAQTIGISGNHEVQASPVRAS